METLPEEAGSGFEDSSSLTAFASTAGESCDLKCFCPALTSTPITALLGRRELCYSNLHPSYHQVRLLQDPLIV